MESAAEILAGEGKDLGLSYAIPFEGQQGWVASDLDLGMPDFYVELRWQLDFQQTDSSGC